MPDYTFTLEDESPIAVTLEEPQPIVIVQSDVGERGPIGPAGPMDTAAIEAHAALTAGVHGIADTSRLITQDNIGIFAPTPDLTALLPRDGSRPMTGPLGFSDGINPPDVAIRHVGGGDVNGIDVFDPANPDAGQVTIYGGTNAGAV